MRPIEALLLLANLSTFATLAVPRLRRLLWARYLAIFALLIVGAQTVVEGPRWQMFPAYALSGLFALAFLPPVAKRHEAIRFHRLAAGLSTAFAVLALAISAALPMAFPVFQFPRPHGPYGIGTLTYHWVDAGRPEIFTADPNDHRELMVQIWYPAKGGHDLKRAPYVHDGATLAPLARLLHLPGFVLGHLKYVMTNAIPSAPVADGAASYPVLMSLHGRGGYRQENTFQIEELVSNGYIVADIDQPYAAATVAFPDGRLAAFDTRMIDRRFEDGMIPYLSRDVTFALDQLASLNNTDENGILTGRLDLLRVGILGVSLGGEVSAEACLRDPRLRACLSMDVWMPPDVVQAGLRQPTMWISRDAGTMRLEGWSEAVTDETLGTMRRVFEELPGDGYLVRVRGMFHADFSDAPLLSPLTSWLGITGPIDPARALRIVSAYSLAFFDRHLKDRPAALLDGPAERFPEVLFETRRHSLASAQGNTGL